MVLKNGYIKLWRSLVEWEWYDDWKTTRLFIHLLITVNYEDTQWQGIEIKRGQRITSVDKLAHEIGLSYQNIRTSINRLKSTGEITTKPTNKYTLITVESYGLHQDLEGKVTSKVTNMQENNQQTTNNKGRRKEEKNIYSAEFEKFYLQYPNAKEKNRTFTNWHTALKHSTAEELVQASKNYADEVKGRQKEFIKTSANFLGKEKPYLDYMHQTKESPPRRGIKIIDVDQGFVLPEDSGPPRPEIRVMEVDCE